MYGTMKIVRLGGGRYVGLPKHIATKIVSGTDWKGKINDDNSFLDCRIKGLEKKSPSVIIIDRNLNLKKNVKILKKIKNKKVIIFTNNFNRLKKKYFEKMSIKIFIFLYLIHI